MFNSAETSTQNLYGVYEVDSGGTVLYHKTVAYERRPVSYKADLTSRNFFDEMTVFQNFRDFVRRYKSFAADACPTEDFRFNFQTPERIFETKVKLIRISERLDQTINNLIIIDIRQA